MPRKDKIQIKKELHSPGIKVTYNDLDLTHSQGHIVGSCGVCGAWVFANHDCLIEFPYDAGGEFGVSKAYHGRCYVEKDPAGMPLKEWGVLGRKFDPERKDEEIGAKESGQALALDTTCFYCHRPIKIATDDMITKGATTIYQELGIALALGKNAEFQYYHRECAAEAARAEMAKGPANKCLVSHHCESCSKNDECNAQEIAGPVNQVKPSCYYESEKNMNGCAWLTRELDTKCGNPEPCSGKKPEDTYHVEDGVLQECPPEPVPERSSYSEDWETKKSHRRSCAPSQGKEKLSKKCKSCTSFLNNKAPCYKDQCAHCSELTGKEMLSGKCHFYIEIVKASKAKKSKTIKQICSDCGKPMHLIDRVDSGNDNGVHYEYWECGPCQYYSGYKFVNGVLVESSPTVELVKSGKAKRKPKEQCKSVEAAPVKGSVPPVTGE